MPNTADTFVVHSRVRHRFGCVRRMFCFCCYVNPFCGEPLKRTSGMERICNEEETSAKLVIRASGSGVHPQPHISVSIGNRASCFVVAVSLLCQDSASQSCTLPMHRQAGAVALGLQPHCKTHCTHSTRDSTAVKRHVCCFTRGNTADKNHVCPSCEHHGLFSLHRLTSWMGLATGNTSVRCSRMWARNSREAGRR